MFWRVTNEERSVCKFIQQMTRKAYSLISASLFPCLFWGAYLVYSGSFEIIVLNLGGQKWENAPQSIRPVWRFILAYQSDGPFFYFEPLEDLLLAQALQASQDDSSRARYWQHNRAVIIGPYSLLRNNPRLGLAFSVPSVIFSLVFTQGMYLFLLLPRLCFGWRLYTQHVCLRALLFQ